LAALKPVPHPAHEISISADDSPDRASLDWIEEKLLPICSAICWTVSPASQSLAASSISPFVHAAIIVLQLLGEDSHPEIYRPPAQIC
jgi:hypothetical protein